MFTPQERARIRGESGCDEQTIRKYPNVSEASRRRIERAAVTLGIELARTAAPGAPMAIVGSHFNPGRPAA